MPRYVKCEDRGHISKKDRDLCTKFTWGYVCEECVIRIVREGLERWRKYKKKIGKKNNNR